ncbi:MAG: aminotransferase class III-fold pyridoxal phosphate-dependent enzyme [Flammeovirgaceae bacterium]
MLDYSSIQINETQATEIAKHLYNLTGKLKKLPGELDFNFRLDTDQGSYILKISRPDADEEYIQYQQQLLEHVANSELKLRVPRAVPDREKNFISKVTDIDGNERLVRLLTWIDGRLWSEVNPQGIELLWSLGKEAGRINQALEGFDHPNAHRTFEWDIAQAAWTYAYFYLFEGEQLEIVSYFKKKFKTIQKRYKKLRKGVVHNDANDNNIIVDDYLVHPQVRSIIDFGDAIYTQKINDLAIAISYGMMNKPDALAAALPIVEGYHSSFPLLDEELEALYVLVAVRLLISVTKSAINRQEEPENEYLFVSEKPAWKALKQWRELDATYAYCAFRAACGLVAHPHEAAFESWAAQQSVSINHLFPSLDFQNTHRVDMSVSSTWLGHESTFLDNELSAYKIHKLQRKHPHTIISGGYLETRPFYITDAYQKKGNNGPEYRAVHLGVDFWVDGNTPIHALFDGTVVCIHNNDYNKDYGPTLILEHRVTEKLIFYTLYGHLTKSTLSMHQLGDVVKKGSLIAYVGEDHENGNWVPHLHFQVMLDLLGNTENFPGVAFPNQLTVWKSICPDPNLLFKDAALQFPQAIQEEELMAYRKKHLGKGMSLSYDQPLKMVRGAGAYLIASDGRKYLDTVNNVAHVGHEHPDVVQAGQAQMAVLNTNTRYLHENINAFAQELLATFPPELSVVHFVNSGSEANELALRMSYTATGYKDMIAMEVGYHGNTNACVEVSSYKFEGKGGKGAPAHTHIVPLPDAFRGKYQGKGTGQRYAQHVQEHIDTIRAKGSGLAGFICESIISCGGQIELPEGFLPAAYEKVRAAGGLCIADEVQTGCGRVGSQFWAFQLHEVVPDIVTIGKPLGNGHPVAAVVCTQAVAKAFANGMEYFNTFGGNPVSCAIGMEVLNVIKREDLQANALKVGNYLKKELKRLQRKFPIIGEVRGQGLFLGVELVDQAKAPLADHAAYLANRMKELGVLMSTDGRDHNVLKIKPPMVFSKANAKEFISKLKTVFKEDFMKTY